MRTTPAAYTGGAATWTNPTLAGRLVHTNPNPNFVSSTTVTASCGDDQPNANAAGDLDNNLTFRNNALAAGLPANFFVVNPHADEVNVRDSGAFSTYHALQLDLRRRLSRGLAFNGSYQYALEEGSAFLGFHFGRASDPEQRVHPSRLQDAVGLDDSGRTRRAVWPQPESGPRCAPRRLAVQRRRPISGAHDEFRQRPAGRDDQGRGAEVVQVRGPARSANRAADRVRLPGRCDSEHEAGVQRQRDEPERLQRSRRPRGSILRAGEQRRLHPAQGRRLRARERWSSSARGSRASTSGSRRRSRSAGTRASSSVPMCSTSSTTSTSASPTRRARRGRAPGSSRPIPPIATSTTPTIQEAVSDRSRSDSIGKQAASAFRGHGSWPEVGAWSSWRSPGSLLSRDQRSLKETVRRIAVDSGVPFRRPGVYWSCRTAFFAASSTSECTDRNTVTSLTLPSGPIIA